MTDRFDELAADYLEGKRESREELTRLLESDPAKRELFVDLVRQERMLETDLRPAAPLAGRVLETLRADRAGFVGGVMSDLRRRRRRLWPVAAAAAILFAVIVALPDRGVATIVGGEIVRIRKGSGQTVGKSGTLQPGDVLRTGERGASFRYIGENTWIELEARTELRIGETRPGKTIELRQGEIEASVAPQRHPMRIVAPHAQALVLGTRLKLSAAPEATRLEVREGKVRLTRESDGESVDVPARHFSLAAPEARLAPEPVPAAPEAAPEVTSFTLIFLDGDRAPVPGHEELQDGAVINLAKLPTRRVNVRANTRPSRVGSLRFAFDGDPHFNTELIWPYTLVPNNGRQGKVWKPAPGSHTITATPFTGTYGNGVRGTARALTITVLDE